MYAIIRSGGKQYRVAEGDRLQVERDVLGNADQDKVTFSEVLMVGGDQPKVGAPTVERRIGRRDRRPRDRAARRSSSSRRSAARTTRSGRTATVRIVVEVRIDSIKL